MLTMENIKARLYIRLIPRSDGNIHSKLSTGLVSRLYHVSPLFDYSRSIMDRPSRCQIRNPYINRTAYCRSWLQFAQSFIGCG